MSEDNKLNMLEDKINLKKVLVRMDVKYFLTNDPPSPFKGWNLPAFQEYCRRELSEVGFDFDRKITLTTAGNQEKSSSGRTCLN